MMTEPAMAISVVGYDRDYQVQRRTGIEALSIRVHVEYSVGSFDLTFPADPSPNFYETLPEILRQKLVDFADQLRESALLEIKIPPAQILKCFL